MNTSFNKGFSNIYLYMYSAYIVLIQISLLSSYSPYLQLIYKASYISFIFINLIFLFILRDSKGQKSNYDYIFAIVIIIILYLRIFKNIYIIPMQLMPIYLFILNLRYVNLDKFIKIDFITKISLLFLILFLFVFHLTPDTFVISHRNGMLRIGAGFGTYTKFSEYVLCVLYSYLLFFNKKINKIILILSIFIAGIVVFYLTDSRGFITSIFILILLLIISNSNLVRNIIEKFSIVFDIIISMLSIIVPIETSLSSSFFYYINKLSSGRLYYQHFATVFYPVRMFGYSDDINKWLQFYNGGTTLYIDNLYLLLILCGGFIGFLIFEFIFIRANYLSLHNYLLCIIFISLSVFVITEGNYPDISMYLPIIYAYVLNYTNKSYNKDL